MLAFLHTDRCEIFVVLVIDFTIHSDNARHDHPGDKRTNDPGDDRINNFSYNSGHGVSRLISFQKQMTLGKICSKISCDMEGWPMDYLGI